MRLIDGAVDVASKLVPSFEWQRGALRAAGTVLRLRGERLVGTLVEAALERLEREEAKRLEDES